MLFSYLLIGSLSLMSLSFFIVCKLPCIVISCLAKARCKKRRSIDVYYYKPTPCRFHQRCVWGLCTTTKANAFKTTGVDEVPGWTARNRCKFRGRKRTAGPNSWRNFRTPTKTRGGGKTSSILFPRFAVLMNTVTARGQSHLQRLIINARADE